MVQVPEWMDGMNVDTTTTASNSTFIFTRFEAVRTPRSLSRRVRDSLTAFMREWRRQCH